MIAALSSVLGFIAGAIVGSTIRRPSRPKLLASRDDQASKLRALCKFGQGDFTREYPRKG